ncbi:MAG: rhodanese-like domain-containing protein [Paludibacteraceae bacterium]|nr:rhodanese-like domain-containing protein [Paludibacteraceae bacterium]
MKRLFLFLALSCALGSSYAGNCRMLSAEQFRDTIKNRRIYLLDVRPLHDYIRQHIPNAANIDASLPDFGYRIGHVNKRKFTIAVYAQQNDSNSETAVAVLKDLGYNVVQLDGGFDAWLDSEFATFQFCDTIVYYIDIGSNGTGHFNLSKEYLHMVAPTSRYLTLHPSDIIKADEHNGELRLKFLTTDYATVELDISLPGVVAIFYCYNKNSLEVMYRCRITNQLD